MQDQEFLAKIKEKIERVTSSEIRLQLDVINKNQIKVDLDQAIPEVTLGSHVIEYSGFSRMAIEYVVASIRERRELGSLEFHILLARN